MQDLFLTCDRGFDGGHSARFHAEVFESSTRFLAHNITRSLPAFHVHQLKPMTSYTVVAYASNALGRSKTLRRLNVTTNNQTGSIAAGGGGGTNNMASPAAAVDAAAAAGGTRRAIK